MNNNMYYHVLNDRGHLFAVPTRVFPLLSPLLSGHQALYRLSYPLIYDETRQPEREGDDRLCTSNAAPVAGLF